MRQDRVSGPALSHSSAPAAETPGANGQPAAPRGIVLSLCLRTMDSSGSPAAVSWASESSAATLAIDIIAASGGSPDAAQGVILPARFSSAQSALLAARRLQWALEGLAESVRSSTTASMAIYPAENPAAASVAKTLENLLPGEVLLTPELAEAVQQVPGMAVNAAATSNWRSLQWQNQNAATSLAADEQSLVGLIRALGREDPCPPRAAEPAPTEQRATGQAATVAPSSGIYEATPALGRSLMGSEAAQPVWKKPWILIGAAGAVVVVAAALVIPAMVSRNRATSPAGVDAPKAASHAAPQSAAPPSSVPAMTEKSREPKPTPKVVKQPRTEAKATPVTEPAPPQPKAPAGSCDLTEGEIPRSLSRAESLMYAGKLEAAQDAYQRLVGCPSAHDKASEGLKLVKQRINAQSSSPQ